MNWDEYKKHKKIT